MLITTFTSYAEIRAVLGVDETELGDEVLSLGLYEDALMADLDGVSLDLADTFTTVSATLDPTAAQKRFLMYTRLFACYAVAQQLLTSLPLFSPKSIEDGKARMERQADPYRETNRRVSAGYDKYQNHLAQALAGLGSTATTVRSRSYMSVVLPASDPITGT